LVVAGIVVWQFWGSQIADFFARTTESSPTALTLSNTSASPITIEAQSIVEAEGQAFELINAQREKNGTPATVWDDGLYTLSKAHTEEMAMKGELFHSPESAPYAENCWGGHGYQGYSAEELAKVIVESWMSSPLHRAWLLHTPLRHVAVSIVIDDGGQYASWTFWKDEIGLGPELVRQISQEWKTETGGSVPWIEWLYMRGYLK
jgi:uncharacterized protein YkwD